VIFSLNRFQSASFSLNRGFAVEVGTVWLRNIEINMGKCSLP